MLTKNLLNYRTRLKKIYPQFLSVDDKDLIELTSNLLRCFEKNKGKSFVKLEEDLAQINFHKANIYSGLKKVLMDQTASCDLRNSEDIMNQRWEYILSAQELRKESFLKTISQFQEQFCHIHLKSMEIIKGEIYSDLPEHQIIENFPKLDAKDLIYRYNCALIQGLLLNSNRLEVTFPEITTEEKRILFRQMKFHRLFCTVKPKVDSSFTMELSGPLDIFSQKQSYGIRLANFLPHIMNIKNWSLESHLKISQKQVKLELTDNKNFKSHYKKQSYYTPPEFTKFMLSFNEKAEDWNCQNCEDFLHLEKQNFCFPDFIFTKKSENHKIYLELFHRWHSNELKKRIEQLEKNHNKNIILAVCSSLTKNKDIKDIMASTKELSKNIFTFSDFPTSHKISKVLSLF